MTDKSDSCHSLSNRYSSLYSLLLADGDEHEILTCLARGLRRLPFESLRLEPITANDASMNNLQLAMESSGFECHRYFRFFNWAHQLQGKSYDEYMAARPARVRSTIARKHRKLEREHGCEIRLYTGGDLQQAVKDYEVVYRASWKGYEPFPRFISGLANTLSKSGWLRLAVLYVAEKPVAAQFWFVVNGKAGIFRLAYDDAWIRYSPGSILTGYLMAYVIDTDNVHEIDFLMGNDRYKQDWMSERRERWGIIFANRREPRPKGKIHLFVELLKGLLKS